MNNKQNIMNSNSTIRVLLEFNNNLKFFFLSRLEKLAN